MEVMNLFPLLRVLAPHSVSKSADIALCTTPYWSLHGHTYNTADDTNRLLVMGLCITHNNIRPGSQRVMSETPNPRSY